MGISVIEVAPSQDLLQSEAQACQKRDSVARRVRKPIPNDNQRRQENSGLFNSLSMHSRVRIGFWIPVLLTFVY